MKSIKRFFTIAFFSLLFISTANAQSEPTEYLSVGKKIEFNGEDLGFKTLMQQGRLLMYYSNLVFNFKFASFQNNFFGIFN